jgi:hypothetical protein
MPKKASICRVLTRGNNQPPDSLIEARGILTHTTSLGAYYTPPRLPEAPLMTGVPEVGGVFTEHALVTRSGWRVYRTRASHSQWMACLQNTR